MKKPTVDHYLEITVLLKELKKKFPRYNMGRHISTALDEYGDVWGMTDKEFVFALNKYKIQLELDEPHLKAEDGLEDIIKGGMNLTLLKEDDEDDFINGQDY